MCHANVTFNLDTFQMSPHFSDVTITCTQHVIDHTKNDKIEGILIPALLNRIFTGLNNVVQ